ATSGAFEARLGLRRRNIPDDVLVPRQGGAFVRHGFSVTRPRCRASGAATRTAAVPKKSFSPHRIQPHTSAIHPWLECHKLYSAIFISCCFDCLFFLSTSFSSRQQSQRAPLTVPPSLPPPPFFLPCLFRASDAAHSSSLRLFVCFGWPMAKNGDLKPTTTTTTLPPTPTIMVTTTTTQPPLPPAKPNDDNGGEGTFSTTG
ncbi:unnamed protein product, partial [Ectocarpus fasciculatus]